MNKISWKYLGYAEQGVALSLPDTDEYDEICIIASTDNSDMYAKYTFNIPKLLIEEHLTGSEEYLKHGSYAYGSYHSEVILSISNPQNNNYIKLNAICFGGSYISGSINVFYR